MKTITITQTYEIEVPKELEHSSKEDLLNMLNRMYDIHGQRIIKYSLGATSEYIHTVLSEIDDEEVFILDSEVRYSGCPIILDGQPLKN